MKPPTHLPNALGTGISSSSLYVTAAGCDGLCDHLLGSFNKDTRWNISRTSQVEEMLSFPFRSKTK